MNSIFLHSTLLQIGFLDTPSVLMITLTALAFIATWGINHISILRIRRRVKESKEINDIMQHTLDVNANYVVRLDLRQRWGYNLHGNFLPEAGIGYEESFKYMHPEDQQHYRRFIASLYNEGANTAECIFRWDISGEEHAGKWRYMHDQGVAKYVEGQKTPINIFCTLSDQTEQILQESEDDPYYFENTLYDMPTFREVLANRHIEELYFCSKTIIMDRDVNCYTEIRVHPIHNELDELVYITLSIRDVTQERELYLQSKLNEQEIRKANEEILNLENEIQYLMDSCDMRFWRTNFADKTVIFYKSLKTAMPPMDFDELRAHFVQSTFKDDLLDPEHKLQKPKAELTLCHPFFHEGEALQWNIIDSVPYHDHNGKQLGTYGIIRNVTPLIQKQEQLKQETERAQNSGRMKSVFMANMTHEIRTPLNAIVGFSDVLSMLETPEEKQEIVKVIMNNCDMLLRLINDILAVSAIDGGGSIYVHAVETNFAEDFEAICKSLAQRIQNPNVAFIQENPYTTLTAVLDKERIQQVITNFVTNAVKYTNEGHIKVGYEQKDGGLYFYCEDTGAGIPKEDQDKIFERFVKLNDYVQGTGLGLNISKAIVEAFHGEIGVKSEGVGHGSTFWFWIPCEIKTEI